MAHEVEVNPDALCIRFRPTAPESVRNSALKEHRRAGHYGCSIFAAAAGPGETETDVLQRLFVAADLDGMTADRHPKVYVCALAGNLLAQGFVFLKDGGDDELAEHYCVRLGVDEPDLETTERFLEQFDRTEKRPR